MGRFFHSFLTFLPFFFYCAADSCTWQNFVARCYYISSHNFTGTEIDLYRSTLRSLIISASPSSSATVTVSLNGDSFKGTQLQEIFINHTSLQFTPEAFEPISLSLTKLTLVNIWKIPDFPVAMPVLPSLTSLHMEFSGITRFNLEIFIKAPNLRNLSLSNNLISDVNGPSVREVSSKLERLDLSGNPFFSVINEDEPTRDVLILLQYFPNLKRLNLTSTGLTKLFLQPVNGFAHQHLYSLGLRGNRLQEVTRGQLSAFPNLKRLILANNPLTRLEPFSFENLKLDFLDLSDNRKIILSGGIFNGSSIKNLDFSFQRTSTPGITVPNWDLNLFSPIRETLSSLNVSGRVITGSLPTLQLFPNLEVFRARRSQIQELPPDFVKGHQRLRILDLSGNSLQTFPKELLVDLARPGSTVEQVLLLDNILSCSCSNSNLGNWLAKDGRCQAAARRMFCTDVAGLPGSCPTCQTEHGAMQMAELSLTEYAACEPALTCPTGVAGRMGQRISLKLLIFIIFYLLAISMA